MNLLEKLYDEVLLETIKPPTKKEMPKHEKAVANTLTSTYMDLLKLQQQMEVERGKELGVPARKVTKIGGGADRYFDETRIPPEPYPNAVNGVYKAIQVFHNVYNHLEKKFKTIFADKKLMSLPTAEFARKVAPIVIAGDMSLPITGEQFDTWAKVAGSTMQIIRLALFKLTQKGNPIRPEFGLDANITKNEKGHPQYPFHLISMLIAMTVVIDLAKKNKKINVAELVNTIEQMYMEKFGKATSPIDQNNRNMVLGYLNTLKSKIPAEGTVVDTPEAEKTHDLFRGSTPEREMASSQQPEIKKKNIKALNVFK